MLDLVEEALGEFILFDHTLAEAAAVPEHQKLHFAAGPIVIQPAVKCRFLSDAVLQLLYPFCQILCHPVYPCPIPSEETHCIRIAQ